MSETTSNMFGWGDVTKGFEDLGKTISSTSEVASAAIAIEAEKLKATTDGIAKEVQANTEKLASDIAASNEKISADIMATNGKMVADFNSTIQTVVNAHEKFVQDITNPDPSPEKKQPYSNPVFDIPGSVIDRFLYEPFHKSNQTDLNDKNVIILLDSGMLEVPETKMLNIPKVVLFGVASFSGTVSVYALCTNKSARIAAVSLFIAHESLRVSYNMYLANTLGLLAKKLIQEPDMLGDAFQGVLQAKAQGAANDALRAIGITEHAAAADDPSIHIQKFVKRLLPKVFLDLTISKMLYELFGGLFAPKAKTS